jgi:hypothetical protein
MLSLVKGPRRQPDPRHITGISISQSIAAGRLFLRAAMHRGAEINSNVKKIQTSPAYPPTQSLNNAKG